MSIADDWLSEEKFDFDVGESPAGETNLIADEDDVDDDDEEVFFGPQSFKEKCAAVVVKEREEITQTELKPEEQAIILRESTLLGLMLKHGTPKSTRSSPVAVVHPMKRENKSDTSQISHKDIKNVTSLKMDKENVPLPEIKATKGNPSKLSMSRILQPKFSVKNRASSEPEQASNTRLPVSKLRGKVRSEFSEPVVDQASLYGLCGDVVKPTDDKNVVRRRSGLPMKQKTESSTAKPKTAVPSLLPSAVPTTRSKTVTGSSSGTSMSKLKPMKVTGIPSSARLQSQSRLPSARKTTASQGTPSKSNKVTSSYCKQSSVGPKATATPVCIKLANEAGSVRKQGSLVTPVQRTPSTRKSITGRKLLKGSESAGASVVAPPLKEKLTTKNSPQEELASDTSNHCSDRQVKPEDCTQDVCVKTLNISPKDIEPASQGSFSPTQTSNMPSHSDILSRYKKLCESRPEYVSDSLPLEKSAVKPVEIDVVSAGELCTEKTYPNDEEGENEYFSNCKKERTEKVIEATLLQIACDSPLLRMSPVKKTETFLDPFHTGNTPPPLIDIGDVLQPERPKENNLIEF